MTHRVYAVKEKWQAIAFPLDLKHKGYDERGNRYNVDPLTHLMRIENKTPGIDFRALQYWSRKRVKTIRAYLTDGRVMETDLAEFIAGGRNIQYPGHGKQHVNGKTWKVVLGNRTARLSA